MKNYLLATVAKNQILNKFNERCARTTIAKTTNRAE